MREIGILDSAEDRQGKRFRDSRTDCPADRSGDSGGAVRHGAQKSHRRDGNQRQDHHQPHPGPCAGGVRPEDGLQQAGGESHGRRDHGVRPGGPRQREAGCGLCLHRSGRDGIGESLPETEAGLRDPDQCVQGSAGPHGRGGPNLRQDTEGCGERPESQNCSQLR